MKLYTKDHEWVVIDGNFATFGITGHAQEQLGDIVYIELPEVGKALAKGAEAAVVESVKAASEVYAPVAGTVAEVNDRLTSDPGLVNRESETGGWFIRLEVGPNVAIAGLMDDVAYQEFLQKA